LHTVAYAQRTNHLTAIELSSTLAERAKERCFREARNVTVVVGSVLELERLLPDQSFDCVISQRCLINLPTWDHQRAALEQIRGRLSPGGLLLITEGFQDELDSLNELRSRVGLPTINVVAYRDVFETHLTKDFQRVAMADYGVYLLLSRVFHPLAVAPDEPRHESRLNEAAMKLAQSIDLPDFRHWSYNLFYALRKN
jgi:ubiquinone/menaquinone biosynthesis C-methylase UbiE